MNCVRSTASTAVPKSALTACVAIATVALSACSDSADERVKYPPCTAELAELKVSFPETLKGIRGYWNGESIQMTFCDNALREAAPQECTNMGPPLVNSHGMRVSVHEPNLATEFELIRERPNAASFPNTDPLIPVHSDLESEPQFYVGNSEWYEVSRVRFGQENPLFTTSEGWPLAQCHEALHGPACRIGFSHLWSVCRSLVRTRSHAQPSRPLGHRRRY